MMSSLSAMSHVAQTSTTAPVGTDSTHSSALMMSQPPSHSGQPDPSDGPYVSVHRVHEFSASAGPETYPHHVMPYPMPQGPPPPRGGELMYAEETSVSQGTIGNEVPGNEGAVSPSVAQGSGSSAPSKRKYSESNAAEGSAKKKRHRASAQGESGEGTGEGPDGEVGPNGGPKHWTEDDKSRFFTWMLTSDEHWDAFRTRMNTVFRECSNELFPGRKSYTALKSCFHRNLDVFKQIHAFETFSANRIRQLQAQDPHADPPPVDTMLDLARGAGLNVGTLNAKTIDRWYEMGWYDLFRRRYREDPKTGVLAPYYGPMEGTDRGPSTASAPPMALEVHTPSGIDPQLMSRRSIPQPQPSENGSVHHVASPEPSHTSSPMQHAVYSEAYAYPSPTSQPSDYRQPGSSTSYGASSNHLRSAPASSSRILNAPPTRSPVRTPTAPASRTHSDLSIPHETSQTEFAAQITQVLARLDSATESLLGVCSSLRELMQQQAEESRARTELLRAEAAQRRQAGALSVPANGQEKDKERDISIEKVTFATEILKNGPNNEDIKKAAIECLTKYLMRGL